MTSASDVTRLPEKKPGIFADIFAGAGVGALLGTILGLSITPVVATVVGALTSVLAVFLGLDGQEKTRLPRVNGLRIGAFGFATIAGLLLGMFLRINNPMVMAPADAMLRWQTAFEDNPSLAQQMMIFERTGLRPSEVSFGITGEDVKSVELDTLVAQRTASVLYNAFGDFDVCGRLRPERLGDPAGTLGTYNAAGSPDVVQQIGGYLSLVSEQELPTALALSHDILCAVKDAEDE